MPIASVNYGPCSKQNNDNNFVIQKQPLGSPSESDQCQGLCEHNDHPSPGAICCPSGFHYKTERYMGCMVTSNSGITTAHLDNTKSQQGRHQNQLRLKKRETEG